jgi:hypothetical protein
MISFWSIVQRNLKMLSMLELAAPSEGTPAAAAVASTSRSDQADPCLTNRSTLRAILSIPALLFL